MEKKLDCLFHFPGLNPHQATAHLFEQEYAGRVFWFGVAQFGDVPTHDLPERPFGMEFEDGRKGLACHVDGKMSGDYFEIGFVGVTTLR